MVDFETFRKVAMSFPEAIEMPHFEKTSFRIRTKIFATFSQNDHKAVVKLSEMDQHLFVKSVPACTVPVAGAWGKHGWTSVDLSLASADIVRGILVAAYCEVAPKKLAAILLAQEDQE